MTDTRESIAKETTRAALRLESVARRVELTASQAFDAPVPAESFARLVDEANQALQVILCNASFLETDQESIPEQIGGGL